LRNERRISGQRDDDARRASHVAESVLVLVVGHFADEFGAVASDSVVDAFDCTGIVVAAVSPVGKFYGVR